MITYDWFSVYGIELEYMIVDARTLDVRPIADEVLRLMAGADAAEVERGPVAWSNELARHVLEVKTNGPCADLEKAAAAFEVAVREVNDLLKPLNARLLPSGMHPWMNPEHEFQLWPIDEEGIYATFDRIFDCRGHGWSNLQSMHINLPFKDDRQLCALHASVRMLLPLLPALSASSPFMEGRLAPNLDQRLHVYRSNAHRVPQVSGHVVPEPVVSREDYQSNILQPIYRALAPLDQENILHHEWVNARGAIARFDRMALEIRVLDTQECPRMDLAIAYLVTETLRLASLEERFVANDQSWPSERLAELLWRVVKEGSNAIIDDAEYFAAWGCTTPGHATARDLWTRLLERLPSANTSYRSGLSSDARWLVEHGSLSERLVNSVGATPDRDQLIQCYASLADCLSFSQRFE